MLKKGQFRKVRYSDDGCTIFQCMWCKQTIEIRDNPDYWNFCPKCGKSWFQRMQCRDHEIPRWYYDRWGNGEEPGAPSVYELCAPRKPSTATWVIECRTKWFDDPWGEWKHEFSGDKDPCKPDWQWAKSMLEYHRGRHDCGDDQIKFEYRVRLEKKKDLTFHIPSVYLSSDLRGLLFKYGRKNGEINVPVQ